MRLPWGLAWWEWTILGLELATVPFLLFVVGCGVVYLTVGGCGA